ncbi:hypothetical protein [Lacticaseibacillus kribbianus]|uniref:hypothetical protein n=1 Tax=Lacticaseibacillus kribbianus TaxID=2926292 RepID=UPI001CD1BB2E|nr:hypothetical protein [Lacticaseibacillus kribbianus]
MAALETIEDYVRFWQGCTREQLQAIAQEHMGGFDPAADKAALVDYLTQGMTAYCEAHDGD